MKTCIRTIGILACAVSISFAQDAPEKPERKNPEAMFKKLDTNSDGSLSKEEFTSAMKGKKAEGAEKRFAKLDADSDGSISLEEFKAAAGKVKEKGKGKGKGKGHKGADAGN